MRSIEIFEPISTLLIFDDESGAPKPLSVLETLTQKYEFRRPETVENLNAKTDEVY